MSSHALFKPAIGIVRLSAACGISGFFVFLAPIIIGFLWDFVRLAAFHPRTQLLPVYFLISQGAWWYYFYKALPANEFRAFWISALRPATIGFEWASKKPKPTLAILCVAIVPAIFVLVPLLVFISIVMEPPRPRSLEAIMLLGMYYMLWGGALGASIGRDNESSAH